MQRVRYLKVFMWAMPERAQQFGAIGYRNVDAVMWERVRTGSPRDYSARFLRLEAFLLFIVSLWNLHVRLKTISICLLYTLEASICLIKTSCGDFNLY
jgi:hypothetical protein